MRSSSKRYIDSGRIRTERSRLEQFYIGGNLIVPFGFLFDKFLAIVTMHRHNSRTLLDQEYWFYLVTSIFFLNIQLRILFAIQSITNTKPWNDSRHRCSLFLVSLSRQLSLIRHHFHFRLHWVGRKEEQRALAQKKPLIGQSREAKRLFWAIILSQSIMISKGKECGGGWEWY